MSTGIRWSWGLGMLLGVAASASLSAIYAGRDMQEVPIGQLIGNLEERLAANPKDVGAHVNLARLHGMAFVGHKEAPVALSQEPRSGIEPKPIPYGRRGSANAGPTTAQGEHLKKGLQHFEAALALEPDNLIALLGSGWLLEQAERKQGAIARYRRVIAIAWPKEKDTRALGVRQYLFTHEAIGYLLPLLDQQKDAAEIADLQAKDETVGRLPRAITPLAIPLRDDIRPGAIVDWSSRVVFDADGSGLHRMWTWIGGDAGWLVYDRSGRGEIRSALQMFGSVTFWLFWKNGYDALAAIDDDADGELTGAELHHLAIWRDRNANGISERGEVRPVRDYGITALSCAFEPGDGVRFAAISPAGARLRNGRTRPTYDVLLRSSRSLTMAVPAPRLHHAIFQERAGEHEAREERVGNPRLRQRE
jgi:tetratricopeptide (TPR) repeat protein